MKTSKYWKKRFEQLESASNAYGVSTYNQIEPVFQQAQRQIQKEIEAWYGRFAKNNEISIQEARKMLSASELKELKWDVNEYIQYGQENSVDGLWIKELENASARVHISRLEALKIRTQQACEVAFGNELDEVDKMATKVYSDSYYHSIFEMQKGFNVGWNIGQIDNRKLQKIISKPWAADGRNFSDRIWQSKTQLINELHTELTRNCILGKAPDEAINAISKKLDVSKNQAGRLVMTEQAYFHSVAQQEAFKDLDVEEFEIVATLDRYTSSICRSMDGKHFPMSEYAPGSTAPPFHPWCRSVTVPYFADNFGGMRAAKDKNGNTYYVPDDMTYNEWEKQFVNSEKSNKFIDNILKDDDKNAIIPNVSNNSKFADIQSASDYTKNFAENVDFSGVKKVNGINEINNTLDELTQRFPTEKFKSISASVTGSTSGSYNFGNLKLNKTVINNGKIKRSYTDWKTHCNENIDIAKDYMLQAKDCLSQATSYSDVKYYKKRISEYQSSIKEFEECAKYSRYGVDESLKGVVTHEYGHAVAGDYFGFISSQVPNKVIEKHHTIMQANSLKTDWNIAFAQAKKSGDIYNISYYASANSHDFFAESFVMYANGEKLPDYIEKLLERTLK
jgi:SPP1 gp7 family putative phage head morphogenesis protein